MRKSKQAETYFRFNLPHIPTLSRICIKLEQPKLEISHYTLPKRSRQVEV